MKTFAFLPPSPPEIFSKRFSLTGVHQSYFQSLKQSGDSKQHFAATSLFHPRESNVRSLFSLEKSNISILLFELFNCSGKRKFPFRNLDYPVFRLYGNLRWVEDDILEKIWKRSVLFFLKNK